MAGRSRDVEVILLVLGAYSVALGPFMILGSMISTGWLGRCPVAQRYSPVNCGGRLANVAEMPSVRSFDGRNAAFQAAT